MEKPLFEASKYKLIYVFRINDIVHAGCLKIGETTIGKNLSADEVLALQPQASILNRYAKERIDSYTKTATIPYDLLYTEVALYKKGDEVCGFRDYDVHDVLKRSGINRKEFQGIDAQGTEWFEIKLETAKNAIKAVKEGRTSLLAHEVSIAQSPIIFRPEQRDAINKTKERFKKGYQMLWNAKMRFGKTLSALQVIKEMEVKRTLIYTHRPDVESGWFKDFGKIFNEKESKYFFSSKKKGEIFSNTEKVVGDDGHLIYFASLQDLRGSQIVGGKFDKNDEVFTTPWDLIIVDEAHEGTQTGLGKAVMAELMNKQAKILRLSGTPFNLFDDFNDEEIYTWDYVMEQRAKAEWDLTHFGDPNPYAELPKMSIYTYDLGSLLTEFADENIAFNFREFFRTNANGNFLHEKDVSAFLNLLVKDDKDNGSCYPFANDTFRNIFRHTLWTVPGVLAAKALSKVLRVHPVFSNFEIVNVAGDGDEEVERKVALDMVEKAIGDNPDETRTITLTCGRLTAGVTVPAWTGVLMLSGSYSTSASSYMQTIFRVQNPHTINGHTKEDCYVFDFAPDRTLQVIASVPRISIKSGTTTEREKDALDNFLNYCPVIAMEGSQMTPNNMTPEKMLQHLKKSYIDKVVRTGFEDGHLYNDELLKLSDIDIKQFDKLKGIIGKTKALGSIRNIVINDQGLTDEQYERKRKLEGKKKKELTEEEKAGLEELRKAKKARQEAISILRGISIRMPLLIYGAEINDENKELTIDNFTKLVDDLSWKEFMPRGVSKDIFNDFKKYYDTDVFTAASKRIRSLARSADKMPIEERIERITGIFATLRNPDKETVLTPWRVVNMHIGDTLGGYCFYKEGYNEAILDPRYIDHGEITDEVFASNTHLLEINSKTGLYPLYLAYNVYRRRLKDLTTSPQTLEEHLKVWDKVVAENIFVICKTPMAKSITRRTLVGFRNAKVNTRYFDDLINQIREKPQNFLKKVVKGETYWKANNNDNMKFNAIVGNPPYQETGGSGGNNDAPLYQHFAKISEMVTSHYVAMIMPSRWFSAGRENLLGEFRSHMLTSGRVVTMICFTNGADVFPHVEIKGGICYYLLDIDYNGKCRYTLVRDGEHNTAMRNLDDFDVLIREPIFSDIVRKVQSKTTGDYVDTIISADTPFGISSNPKESKKNPMKVYESSSDEHDTMLFHIEKNKRREEYVSRKDIKKNKAFIDRHKVFIPGAGGSGNDPYVLGVPEYAPKNTVCSQSYLFASFDTETEAKNFIKYLESRFFRSLVASIKISQSAPNRTYRFVPLQDFTNKSDIDWSQSVADIDQQLYKKYGLTPEEQQFIETMIKPM